jgi:hypothetical protein
MFEELGEGEKNRLKADVATFFARVNVIEVTHGFYSPGMARYSFLRWGRARATWL